MCSMREMGWKTIDTHVCKSFYVNLFLFLLLFLFRPIFSRRLFTTFSISDDLDVAHICSSLTSYKHNLCFLRYLAIYVCIRVKALRSHRELYVIFARAYRLFESRLWNLTSTIYRSYMDIVSLDLYNTNTE